MTTLSLTIALAVIGTLVAILGVVYFTEFDNAFDTRAGSDRPIDTPSGTPDFEMMKRESH